MPGCTGFTDKVVASGIYTSEGNGLQIVTQTDLKLETSFQLTTSVWIITTPPSATATATATAITLICPGETSNLLQYRSHFIYYDYPLAVLHCPTSIYPHIMTAQL